MSSSNFNTKDDPAIAAATITALTLGLIVLFFFNAWILTLLWAWLVPILFPGAPIAQAITFWQAWGTIVFFAFLFPARWIPQQSKD